MERQPDIASTLEACFSEIAHTRMDGIPIMNDALPVKAVCGTPWNGYWLGILLTPWFMNIVLVPQPCDENRAVVGAKRSFELPCGVFEFIRSHEPALGGFWMCSLFSPVFEFENEEAAVLAARSAFDQLMAGKPEIDEGNEQMARIMRGELAPAENAVDENLPAVDDKKASAAGALSRRGFLTAGQSGPEAS